MLDYIRKFREWSKNQKHIQLFWVMMTIVASLFLILIALSFSYHFTTAPIPNSTFIAKINERTTLEYSPHQNLYNLTLTYIPDSGDSSFLVKTGATRAGATSNVFQTGRSFTNLSYGVPIVYQFWASGHTQGAQIMRLTTISSTDGAAYTETAEYTIITQGFSPTYEYIPTLSVEGHPLLEIPIEVHNYGP